MSASGGGDCVVYRGAHDVSIERMDAPPRVGAGEVLVRVEGCAICGTDVKSWHKGNPRIQPPLVIGHEFAGVVEAVGAGVAGVGPGVRVAMATTHGCGACRACRAGRSNLCAKSQGMGTNYPGAMAPWVVVPAAAVRAGNLVEVGDLETAAACLVEPLSCVVNGFSRLPPMDGWSVLVVGQGPLGLLHALVARERQAARVVCSQAPGVRADLARGLGFTVVSPDRLDESFRELSGGEGFDLVAVTAPDNAMQARAPGYARKGGYVSLFASLPPGNEILATNSRTIHYGELVVYGTSDSTAAHAREAVALIRRAPGTYARLVTHRLGTRDFVKAVAAIDARSAVKVVLTA